MIYFISTNHQLLYAYTYKCLLQIFRSVELSDTAGLYRRDDELSTDESVSDILKSSCLSSLSWNDGAPGYAAIILVLI